CQRRAAAASMQVETEVGLPVPERGDPGRQQRLDRGVPLENGREAIFHDDGDAQIGTGGFHNFERGGGQNAVPKRTQSDYSYARAIRKALEYHYSSIFASSISMTGISSRIG